MQPGDSADDASRACRAAIRRAPGTRVRRRAVKLAVVVQRYGQAINGGAELHARYIAEHLARHAEVEVLTTCATRLRHVAERACARRASRSTAFPSAAFPVKHERDPRAVRPALGSRLRAPHSLGDELDWLDAEGPDEPRARRSHRRARGDLRFLLCSSATATTTRITARGRRPAGRFSCRRPSATRRSAWRCFSRCSAAFAR